MANSLNLEVPALDLVTELALHHMIIQIMEKHLAGFETTIEEDEAILKGDVDWTTYLPGYSSFR